MWVVVVGMWCIVVVEGILWGCFSAFYICFYAFRSRRQNICEVWWEKTNKFIRDRTYSVDHASVAIVGFSYFLYCWLPVAVTNTIKLFRYPVYFFIMTKMVSRVW